MPHGGTREAITVQFDNEIWDTLDEREVLCPAAPAARACGMDDGRKGAAVVVVLRQGKFACAIVVVPGAPSGDQMGLGVVRYALVEGVWGRLLPIALMYRWSSTWTHASRRPALVALPWVEAMGLCVVHPPGVLRRHSTLWLRN